MRKTTLKFENYSSSFMGYIGQNANFEVPGHAFGDNGVLVAVDADLVDKIKAAVMARQPAMVITTIGDFDDGIDLPATPYRKINPVGTSAPGATNDEIEYYCIGSLWIDIAASPKETYVCVDATEGAAVWVGTVHPSVLMAPEKSPVNAASATGVLTTNETLVADGDTVTIGETVYTFKTALSTEPAVPYEVLIGADTVAQMANLALAVNGGAGEGINYATGTVAHPDVSGEVDGTDFTVTRLPAGAAGNLVAKADDSVNLDWDGDGEVLTGGIDGTVGVANEICEDGTYLYLCIADNDVSHTNWRRISMGSAY
jgi:hypothetical protein